MEMSPVRAKPTTEQALLSTDAAQHRLGDVGRTTLYRLIRDGELSKVNIGRRVFVTADSVSRYIDRIQQDTVDLQQYLTETSNP